MFKELHDNGKLAGFILEREGKLYFFGTAHTRREDLSRLFPRFEFTFLKQVHARDIVEAAPGVTATADGHYTEQSGLALVVQSADCMPVLLSSPKRVCAVHAGWRGMALNILSAAQAKTPGLDFAALGPHILRESFEVGVEVADELHRAAPVTDASLSQAVAADPSKRLFDLKRLAAAQLSVPLVDCSVDTKTTSWLHSYRRGKSATDRNYSFVVII